MKHYLMINSKRLDFLANKASVLTKNLRTSFLRTRLFSLSYKE